MANKDNSILGIDEGVEAFSLGHVTKRKVFGFIGLLWIALGAAALLAQNFDKDNGSTTMFLLMAGLCLIIYGLIKFFVKKDRFFYDDKPMKMREFMADIGHSSASKMKLKVLFATDYSIAFSQIFKFVEYDFVPSEPIRVHDKAQCNNLNNLVVSY